MSNPLSESPIGPAAQAVLDLFTRELAAVRFPDIDGEVLRGAAERVYEHADVVARLETQLQAAHKALLESQEALLQRCQRALAYARIYAEDDPELQRRLDQVVLPRGRGRGPVAPADSEPRSTGRRRRAVTQSAAPLFLEVPGEAAELPPQAGA